MLRRRSRAVSEHSQHMAGKAMDFRLPDVDIATLRAAAMQLQYGGVGYYPTPRPSCISTPAASAPGRA